MGVLGFGCKSIQTDTNNARFKTDVLKTKEEISIKISNISPMVAKFPNLKMLIIERLEGDSVVRVPYNPCKCGVPCNRPGIPIEILPGKSVEVSWDYISRKCKGRESTEYRIDVGEYRIGINYMLIKDGRVAESDTFYQALTME
jgi:hypothetical protein